AVPPAALLCFAAIPATPPALPPFPLHPAFPLPPAGSSACGSIAAGTGPAGAQPSDARIGRRAKPRQPPHPLRRRRSADSRVRPRSEEHTSELQSLTNLVCRLLLEKKNTPQPTLR